MSADTVTKKMVEEVWGGVLAARESGLLMKAEVTAHDRLIADLPEHEVDAENIAMLTVDDGGSPTVWLYAMLFSTLPHTAQGCRNAILDAFEILRDRPDVLPSADSNKYQLAFIEFVWFLAVYHTQYPTTAVTHTKAGEPRLVVFGENWLHINRAEEDFKAQLREEIGRGR